MKKQTSKTDYIFLAIFGLGAIVIFYIEITSSNPQPNQRETALYNILELGLSLGFGWILQRIDARKQFQENLKQFVLSAYRRITDIEKSVNRLRNEISRMRLSYSQDNIHELDILKMVVEEMNSTVKSSIADWDDVIGEEISKREKIQELQKQQQILIANKTTAEDEKIYLIKNEITQLRSELPLLMRPDDQNYDALIWQVHVSIYFDNSIETQSCINLKVHSYNGSPLSDEILKNNQPYFLRIGGEFKNFHVSVVNKNNELVGEVDNPFRFDEIHDDVFIEVLLRKISNSLEIDPDKLSPAILSSIETQYMNISPNYPNEFYIKIPINSYVAFNG